MNTIIRKYPLILSPAGNKDAFLAAIAAGADAVYCGLKAYSARMEAKNFSIAELASLTESAHGKGKEVYVAFNSLIKPDDTVSAARLLDELNRYVKPDALILQDLSLISLARQVGFSGQLHLSTLANLSFPKGLEIAHNMGIRRVVIPRELSVDEIRAMSDDCPDNLELEVFVHGALCYAVSGRCYWSSFLGGKSGLRGRCVQPCRRFYSQDRQKQRFFSCQDLSLDVLVKLLLTLPKIRTWKIEGRKKSPHYVFYTTAAYKLLRDEGHDPKSKKNAVALLDRALGRVGTHYYFLPQRPQEPVNTEIQTGSGLLMGILKGPSGKLALTPVEELLPGDLLRVGYEDDLWHHIVRISKYVPKKGTLHLKFPQGKFPPRGAPVFLTDRREKALEEMIAELERELPAMSEPSPSSFQPRFPKASKQSSPGFDIYVHRTLKAAKHKGHHGVWFSADTDRNIPASRVADISWWLPPVIWAEHQDKWAESVESLLKKGAKHFVLNAPWQMAFFSHPRKLNIWAGPFCNIANGFAIEMLASSGFSGVIVSPELGKQDYKAIAEHSPLPLGIVISANWPLCISRTLNKNLKPFKPFSSPKGEEAYPVKHEDNFWIYPNWKLDLSAHKDAFREAGYRLFVHLNDIVPEAVRLKERAGLWNFDHKLL